MSCKTIRTKILENKFKVLNTRLSTKTPGNAEQEYLQRWKSNNMYDIKKTVYVTDYMCTE